LKLQKDRRTFNSIAGMSPGNPAIEALRKIPVAPGIDAHSIIPTLQDGPLDTRNDGVVEYKSAHIDGVASELVIEHSDHSTQSNPLTVREVRRILLERVTKACPQGCEAPAPMPVAAVAPGGGSRRGQRNGIPVNQVTEPQR
jgi:hypothetical protein